MSIDHYSMLTQYGTFYSLDLDIKNPNKFVKWTEENFEYVKYNPRKEINRWGLSITSLDGGLSGRPDLDSLIEYNEENGTTYKETDFVTKTPVYDYPELKEILDPFEGEYHRTHILKLGPGGFFPPHRDIRNIHFRSFRLIVPLVNVNPPYANFVLEDRTLHWKPGQMYFVDTAKMHYLFNASISESSYWIVLNVNTNENTLRTVCKYFSER